MSLLRMIHKIFQTGFVTEDPILANRSDAEMKPIDYRGEELRRRIREILGGSLHIRHLDSGSCNGCDWEIAALLNPIYDIQRFGIDFVASPRHADMILATGGITRNLAEAVEKTWEATPNPKILLAVGDCAIYGGVFGETYAHFGGINKLLPVCVSIPGCPPRPQALIDGILLALDRLESIQKPKSLHYSR
jgi:Ni,Fe-hydrogenase III small subunit